MPVLISVSYNMNTWSISTLCSPFFMGGTLVLMQSSIEIRSTYTLAESDIMWGFVHATPEKFEKAAKARTTVHTNPSRKRNFFKTLALIGRICVDGKHFTNRASWKRWRHASDVISLSQFSSKTNQKWPVMLRFKIPSPWYGLKTFYAFSNLRFQIPPAWCALSACKERYIAITPLPVSTLLSPDLD